MRLFAERTALGHRFAGCGTEAGSKQVDAVALQEEGYQGRNRSLTRFALPVALARDLCASSELSRSWLLFVLVVLSVAVTPA